MTTPDVQLVIVRLIPIDPCPGADFRKPLEKLKIEAYDLSVSNTSIGALIGAASGLAGVGVPLFDSADPNAVYDPLKTPIFQNFTAFPATENLNHVLFPVGTAVIVVEPPLNRTTLSLRLEFRLVNVLVGSTIGYNANVLSMSLVPNQDANTKQTSIATYFSLPINAPSYTSIQLPSGGSPPGFSQLLASINAALDQNASTNHELRKPLEVRQDPLTTAQSQEIASANTWN